MARWRRNAAGGAIVALATVAGMVFFVFDDGRNPPTRKPQFVEPMGRGGIVVPPTPLAPDHIDQRRGVEPGTPRVVNPAAESRRPVTVLGSSLGNDGQVHGLPVVEKPPLPRGCDREFRGHANWVSAVCPFDSQTVFSASIDKTIWRWTINDDTPGQPVAEFDQAIIAAVVQSLGSRVAAILANGSVAIAEIGKPGSSKSLTLNRSARVTCAANVGEWLVVGDSDGWLTVWEWDETRLVMESKIASTRIVAIRAITDFHERERNNKTHLMAVVDATGALRHLSLAPGDADDDSMHGQMRKAEIEIRQVALFPHSPRSQSAVTVGAIAANGHRIAIGGRDGVIEVQTLNLGHKIELRGHAGWVNTVAFSPCGTLLASGGADRTIRIWQLDDTTEVARFDGVRGPVAAVAWLPSGNQIVTAGGAGDPIVRLWTLPDAQTERAE